MHDLGRLLARQSGVVARRQLLEVGCAPHDVRRLLRRRELTTLSSGVYLNHTGEPTSKQREWAAVLAVWPAALCHWSALPSRQRPTTGSLIHVAVDRGRSPAAPSDVRLHRMTGLGSRVIWAQSPPRVRIEEAVLDVAAETRDEVDAVAAIADVVHARLTTADRIADALARRSRIARRALLASLLSDVGAGTCSALEHGYLTRVERPHRLPAAARQVRASVRGTVYRDVVYLDQMTCVELDGRLFHDTASARDRDLDRDLDAAIDGSITIRLGWGQVFGRPCETAVKVGLVLRRRGWPGAPVTCPDCVSSGPRYTGAAG